MIKTRTVFVLGAGASKPFGFPTGAELRAEICSFHPGHACFDAIVAAGHDPKTVQLFVNHFERSSFQSIDRFLAMREGLDIIGRDVIAAAVLAHQQRDAVHAHPARARGDADWYGYLWNRMIDGTSSPQEVVSGNQISFVTFNYDTSLEQFFFNAFVGGYGLGRAGSIELASKISIHHVYGSLAISEEDGFAPQEGIPKGDGQLRAVASRLAVMPHHRPPIDPEASALLASARQIFYMGFGYDEMNCARLGIEQARAPLRAGESSSVSVFGTALDLTNAERGIAGERVMVGSAVSLADLTCLELLRENAGRLT